MALNTNQIEKRATDAVSTGIMASPLLDPIINSNDKTPCWDGEVFVYKSTSFCNENLLGRVPIQVKGREKKGEIRKVTYSCEVSVLENYYRDGGCIFFLAYIDPNNINISKIYYKKLLILDLDEILRKSVGKNNTTITLEPFPKRGDEVKDIFVSFLSDRQKQSPFIGKEIPTIQSLEGKGAKIKNLSMTVSNSVLKNSTIPEYLLSHETYVYAEIEGLDGEIILDKLTPENTEVVLDGKLEINGKTFFDRYTLSKDKGEYLVKFGAGIYMNVDSKRLTIKLNRQDTLDELINETEFFLEIVKSGSFVFKGKEIKFDIDHENENGVEEQVHKLGYLKDVKNMLDFLGVIEKLKINNLTNIDYTNINNFINNIIHGNPIQFTNMEADAFYGPFTIGNLNIWIFGYIQDKEKRYYRIRSFFEKAEVVIVQFSEEDEKQEHPINISQYFLLHKDGIARASNINYQAIYDDLVQLPKEEIYIDNLVLFILDLIGAYDLKQKKLKASDDKLLQLAFDLLSWLGSNKYLEGVILDLNILQVIKRQRPLNKDERDLLFTILDNSTDFSVKCGASILLGNLEQALFYLNKLPEQEELQFKNYPIYNLISQ